MSIDLGKLFSKPRIRKAIDNLEHEQIVDFGYFSKLGGASRQTSAFLRSCDDVEYLGKGQWKKL